MDSNQTVTPPPLIDINTNPTPLSMQPSPQPPNSPFQDRKVKIGLSVSALAVLGFLAITFIAPLKSTLFSLLYPKPSSHAAAVNTFPDNPIQTWGLGGGLGGSANGVFDMVVNGNGAYVAGNFTLAGPYASMGVPVDTSSGQAVSNFPKVVPIMNASGGDILSAIPDGKGGWYIGGAFEKVGSTTIGTLAHINPDMSLDQNFVPNATGTVDTIAMSSDGTTLYIGGSFGSIGGQIRNNIASIDATTGALKSWNPNADSTVQVLKLSNDGTTFYIGGNFSNIGGQSRNHIAQIDLASGNATAWNPGADATVNTILISPDGKTVYLGGGFGTVNNQTIARLAQVDATTGSVNTAWNPNPNGSVFTMVFSADHSLIYIGGNFNTVGSFSNNTIIYRHGLAAISVATGIRTSWDPNTGGSAVVNSLQLAPDNTTLYVGGSFYALGGQPRYNVTTIDSNTGSILGWNPGAGGPVAVVSLNSQGTVAYIGLGGSFENGLIGPNLENRSYIAKLLPDGTIDPNFNSDMFSTDISTLSGNQNFHLALSPDGSKLFVASGGVKELDAITGKVITAFNPTNNNQIADLLVSPDNSTIYIGGDFTTINGQARYHFAALNTATGALLPWNPNAACPSSGCPAGTPMAAGPMVFSKDGTRIFMTNIVVDASGTTTTNLIAVDPTNGTPTSWSINYTGNNSAPSTGGYVLDMVLSPDGNTLYLTGNITGIGGHPENRLAAVDIATASATSFSGTLPQNIQPTEVNLALSPDGSILYLGGSFVNVDFTSNKNYLASIDAQTGALTCWNPTPNNAVNGLGLSPDGSRLYVGGIFTNITHTALSSLAIFVTGSGNLNSNCAAPTPTSGASPTNTPTPTPGTGSGPTNTPTPVPTNSPTPLPTNTPTPTFTPTPTPGSGGTIPTDTPTSTPTPTPTPAPQPGAPSTGFRVSSFVQTILNTLNSLF